MLFVGTRRTLGLHLTPNQTRVERAALQQLLVLAECHNGAVAHHEDDVAVHNRTQTMSHGHHGTRMTTTPTLQRLQELLLVLAVQRTRRLVQQQNRRLAKNRASQRQALLLTSRQRLPCRAQIRLKSIRHLVYEVHTQRLLTHTSQLFITHFNINTHQHILANRPTEHTRLLVHHAQLTAEPIQIQLVHVHATQRYHTRIGTVETL